MCSSWKIQPGAAITCLVWASWPCAEGCAGEVTHVCHTRGVQCSASPADCCPDKAGTLLELLLEAVWDGSSCVLAGPRLPAALAAR